jgi:hypothetical protein
VSRKIRDQWFVIEFVTILFCTSGALLLCQFQVIRRLLLAWARMTRPLFGPMEAEALLCGMERVASRFRGMHTCLAVALAAEALMKKHGHGTVLCLGAKRERGRFAAHAWLERDNSVVIGGPKELTLEYSRFSEIPV